MVGGVALLFPGQGSQQVGMGRALAQRYPEAAAVFEAAERRLPGITRLCFEGPEEELRLTANTQPAILVVSAAALRVLEARGVTAAARAVAGHSLGEYTALVAAGALTLEDAIDLVRLRGEQMQAAVPPGRGAMAALIGLSEEQAAEVCREAQRQVPGEVVVPANLNAPGQVVVSGHAGAVNRAVQIAKERGATRAIPLPVSGPFHSPLMAPAAGALAEAIAKVPISPLRIPLVSNVTADYVTDPETVRRLLVEQLTHPVLWSRSIERLVADGASAFLEVGPGNVLCGLVRRISREELCLPMGEPEALEKGVARLGEDGLR